MIVYPSGELLASLNAPAYSIAETSRLIGIPSWSVSRYLRGYEYKYRTKEETREGQQPPVVSQSDEGATYASFLDLVDLLFVKEFLGRGFTLQHLRLALIEAKTYLGTPHFARSEFYTSGDQIVLKLPKQGYMIALITGGQIAIPEIIEKLSDKLDFETITEFGLVQRWYPKGKSGMIVIDPQVCFGRPTLIGRGTATSNIYDLYLGESEQVEPVSKWFNIPVPDIKAAVQFEHSLWG
ncbi:MAG TPA: hypothetical protein VJG32_16000 [Anaerolineae bacterium]|nr:hypothetical protein [Anaerolineae bacterium]